MGTRRREWHAFDTGNVQRSTLAAIERQEERNNRIMMDKSTVFSRKSHISGQSDATRLPSDLEV